MHLSEFATASVSSPGLEDYLGLPDAMIADAEQGIGLLVDGLDYLNILKEIYDFKRMQAKNRTFVRKE